MIGSGDHLSSGASHYGEKRQFIRDLYFKPLKYKK